MILRESVSKSLVKNTFLNLAGQTVPLLVGVIAIPILVREIGIERFGLLSLAWLVIGYFTFLDLGMGRSATKFVAEALGKDTVDDVPSILRSALSVQLAMGLLGAVILYFGEPILVEKILNIPTDLQDEAHSVFRILSVGIPIVLLSATFSGVLEAVGRFDLINIVRVPSSIGTFLSPMLGSIAGLSLPGLVLTILVLRVCSFLAFLILSCKYFPVYKLSRGKLSILPLLCRYGGWLTISNIAAPFLLNIDRFLIGSLASVAALSYYVAPSEALGRLGIIPASLSMSLFPAFSKLSGQGEKHIIQQVVCRSVKAGILIMGPIILVVTIFAEAILDLWLGGQFPAESSLVLRILALGVFANSLAIIPYTLLQSTGRPDLTAKFHLIEIVIYSVLAVLLIKKMGINGAAIAWTIRSILDCVLVTTAAFRLYGFIGRCAIEESRILKGSLGIVAFGLLLMLTKYLLNKPVNLVLAILSIGTIYLFYSWKYVLDYEERAQIIGLINKKIVR